MLQTFSPISIIITLRLHKEYAMHDALKVKRHVTTNLNIILTITTAAQKEVALGYHIHRVRVL